jgi:hypothetical protein
VVLDQEAVLRTIQKRLPTSHPEVTPDGFEALDPSTRESLVAEYRESQERVLGSLLGSYKESRAWVDIQPFVVRERAPEAAPVPASPDPRLTALPPWVAPVVVGLGGAALGALALLWGARILGRRLSPGVPSEHGLKRARALCDGDVDLGGRLGVGEVLRNCGLRADALVRAGHPSDGLLRTVDDTSTRVRRRPEVAAAVLRFWLSQDTEETPEGATRS